MSGALAGRVAVITGAGDGIGRGIARRFAREGAAVLVAELHEDTGRQVAKELTEEFGASALSSVTDVSSRADVEACARELASRGVRLLVAGVAIPGAQMLPTLDAHPALQPMLLVQSFYRLANALAVARGHDPDRPPHLRKVTRTL